MIVMRSEVIPAAPPSTGRRYGMPAAAIPRGPKISRNNGRSTDKVDGGRTRQRLIRALIAGLALGFTVLPQSGICALANGNACVSSGDCISGNCVDGVCCNSPCGGGATSDCQACSVAAGAAVDGTCSPLSNTTVCRAAVGACDVAEYCDGSALTCGTDAYALLGSQPVGCNGPMACDGSGTCALANGGSCTFGSECASGFCTGGICSSVGVPTLSEWGIIVFSCLALGFVLWQTRRRSGAS